MLLNQTLRPRLFNRNSTQGLQFDETGQNREANAEELYLAAIGTGYELSWMMYAAFLDVPVRSVKQTKKLLPVKIFPPLIFSYWQSGSSKRDCRVGSVIRIRTKLNFPFS
jgi:hypothetical protein